MSLHTFTISEKKLGFLLDKTKFTPTIGKITQNGALEKQLIESCSTISVGSKIKYINEDSIENYEYEKAVNFIKNYNSRPINITIESPRKSNVYTKVNPLDYELTNKITPEEMDKISEIKTKEELKKLSNIYNESRKRKVDEIMNTDSDSDSEYNDKYNKKYETQLRNLRFEINNLEVEKSELKDQLKNKRESLELINDFLCHINNINTKFDLLFDYTIGSRQIEKNMYTLNKQHCEYIRSCENTLKNTDLYQICNCISFYLNTEKEKMNHKNNKLNRMIYVKLCIEIFKLFSVIVVIILAFIIPIFDIKIN